MSIKAKIAALTAVALAITGSVASTTTPAEAHGFSHYGFSHHGFNHYGFNHYDFNHYDFNHYGFGSEVAANDGYEYGGDHYCHPAPRRVVNIEGMTVMCDDMVTTPLYRYRVNLG